MSNYHNDQPIQGDQNDPDLLNRVGFANHLAEILLLDSQDDCLTVSLEGEWGYGKTSVINLVKTALSEKDAPPIIIEYNPWLAGKPESLIQDFLLQFSSQMNITDSSEVALNAAKELIAYSSLFSVAKLVPGAEPWASIVEKITSSFGKTTKKIAELKKLDLLGKKKQVEAAIEKIKSPIVVIIDDIDRLTPPEAFQVLRLVKAVADFSGTSFLLAFDAKYLASVLKKNHIENSSEYINKVIQLRVSLPLISDRDMNGLADNELKNLNERNLTEQFEGDDERLGWIYHKYFKHLIRNPRELKRFFNHLRFVLGQVEGEVCFADLFSLSIIATKAGELYEHIKRRPEAYIGQRFTYDGLMISKSEKIIEELEGERESQLESFSDGDKKLIKGLLGDIFPVNGSGSFSIFGVSDTDAAGRVSAPQRLHIALHYKTPTGYISDQEIIEFIAAKDAERRVFIENVLMKDADERFFEMMTNYSSECKANSLDILTAIYDLNLQSKKVKAYQESNYGFVARDPYREMVWLTNKIISESGDKFTLIKSLVGRHFNAPIGADVLHKARSQIHGQGSDESWITSEQLKELETIFQEAAIKALSNKLFLENHLESHIFYELKISSKERASKYINGVLSSENGVIRVAEIIGRSGNDSTNGPYAEIRDEKLADVVDLKLLREKAAEINHQDLPIHIQAIIKSILDGKKYYLRDATTGERW